MDSEFHLFSQFPLEIQHLIWDAAVRPIPGLRGVQRFFIFAEYIRFGRTRYPHARRYLDFKNGGRSAGGFSVAVPTDDPYGGPNDSVYELDSGLWMACRASRAAMERYYSRNEWWMELGPERLDGSKRSAAPGRFLGEENVSHSASYVDDDGVNRYITFDVGRDLIFLDPRHLDHVDWFHHYAHDGVLIKYPKQGDLTGTVSSFLGRDIGIEYDPRMLDTLQGKVTHYCRRDLWMTSMSIIDMVDVFHELARDTIWFVDYRLQPISCASIDIQGRERFYTSNAVLIEVKSQDLNTTWDTDTTEDGLDDTGKRTLFEFFHQLDQEAGGRLEILGSDRMRALAYCPLSEEARRPLVQLRNAKDPTCLTCFPKEGKVGRVRPRLPADDEDDVFDDISLSDLNLFD